MWIVPEAEIAGLVTTKGAFDAVEKVFASMAKRTARNFPVIREAIGHEDALYGFKSGFDLSALNLGLKSGGYWPGNVEKGLTNHQSTVFLFDANTGKCRAVVGGNLLTALRTAAAAAVSVRHLARDNSRILGIMGAGHQAPFQLRAVAAERRFERVVAWNRSPDKLKGLADVARDMGLDFEAVSPERLGAEADVIVTITSSYAALIGNDMVRPGTHFACMGTDTKGKQEIDATILSRARVFTDEVAQSITIGEAQHAVANGLIEASSILELGAVINSDCAGRTSDDDITIFDGTGVGLQDLAVAAEVLERAIDAGVAQAVDF
jgi:ornithine cyclodeaminase